MDKFTEAPLRGFAMEGGTYTRVTVRLELLAEGAVRL